MILFKSSFTKRCSASWHHSDKEALNSSSLEYSGLDLYIEGQSSSNFDKIIDSSFPGTPLGNFFMKFKEVDIQFSVNFNWDLISSKSEEIIES